MFNYRNDNINAMVTVSIDNGPSTDMYYPHGENVEFHHDYFTIGSRKYIPVVDMAPYGLGRIIHIKEEMQHADA